MDGERVAVLGNEAPIALLAVVAIAGCGGATAIFDAAEAARVFAPDELHSPLMPDLSRAAAAPGIPVMGMAAAVEVPEQGRYGTYVAAGIVPARWVWRTGTDGVLEAKDLGREWCSSATRTTAAGLWPSRGRRSVIRIREKRFPRHAWTSAVA